MHFDFDFTNDAINEFNTSLRYGYDDSKELEKTDGRDVARETAVERAVDAINSLLRCEWRWNDRTEPISHDNATDFGLYLGELAAALYYLHGDAENEDEISDASCAIKDGLKKYF